MDEAAKNVFERLESALDQWSAELDGADAAPGESDRAQEAEAEEDLSACAPPAQEPPVGEDIRKALARIEEGQTALAEGIEAIRAEWAEWRRAQAQTVEAVRTQLAQIAGDVERVAPLGPFVEGQLRSVRSEHAHLAEQMEAMFRALQTQRTSSDAASAALAQALRERDQALEAMRRVEANLRAGRPVSPERVAVGPVVLQPFNRDGTRRRLGEMLVASGVIAPAQLEEALAHQKGAPQKHLGALLIELGLTGEEVVAQTLACQLQLRYVMLDPEQVDVAVARLIPARLAALHRCIPIEAHEDRVVLAMANPLDLVAIEDVERATDRPVEPAVATAGAIAAAIARHFAGATPGREAPGRSIEA